MPLMKCGHTSQAIDKDGNPSCVICWPDANASIVEDAPPDLSNRKARCSYFGQAKSRGGDCDYPRGRNSDSRYCNCVVPSDPTLPFFHHMPDKDYDEYYCGCGGWD